VEGRRGLSRALNFDSAMVLDRFLMGGFKSLGPPQLCKQLHRAIRLRL
jgi:hypothetical protein